MKIPVKCTVNSCYLEFQGLSEILQDIRTLTYQICRIEEKLIRTTTFNIYVIGLLKLEIYWKYCRKEEKYWKYCSKEEKLLLLFSTIFLPVVRFSCLSRNKIFTSRQAVIQDKRGRDNESQLYVFNNHMVIFTQICYIYTNKMKFKPR